MVIGIFKAIPSGFWSRTEKKEGLQYKRPKYKKKGCPYSRNTTRCRKLLYYQLFSWGSIKAPRFLHGVIKSLGVESGNKARFYIYGVAIMTTIRLPHF